MKRNRINIRMTDKLWERLKLESVKHDASMTAIIETALDAYFHGHNSATNATATLLERMDLYDLRQQRVETDIRLCTESLGQYVFYWLIHLEQLPEEEREPARAIGKRRYDAFIEEVARRIARPTRKESLNR